MISLSGKKPRSSLRSRLREPDPKSCTITFDGRVVIIGATHGLRARLVRLRGEPAFGVDPALTADSDFRRAVAWRDSRSAVGAAFDIFCIGLVFVRGGPLDLADTTYRGHMTALCHIHGRKFPDDVTNREIVRKHIRIAESGATSYY